jgi:hypothetical protein
LGELLGGGAEKRRGGLVKGAQPDVASVIHDAHARHIPIDAAPRVHPIAGLAVPPLLLRVVVALVSSLFAVIAIAVVLLHLTRFTFTSISRMCACALMLEMGKRRTFL